MFTLRLFFGHSQTRKWVRNPIGARHRVLHPLGVARNQRNNPSVAPFEAALPYTAAAVLSLAIGSAVTFPTPLRLGLPTTLMAAALSRAVVAWLMRERLRERADSWLAEARSPNPSVYAWRVGELARSERRIVGRTLSTFAEEVTRPYRRGAPILNRLQLRPQTELLLEVAHALQDPRRDASPRAIARTRLLITDCGSPLNCSARHDELHQELTSILADISEPRAAGERNRAQRTPTPFNESTPRGRPMTAVANMSQRRTAHAFDINGPIARLCAADGGCEIVHESTRFQIYVYALVAPEPEDMRVHADDTLYIVLEGSGMLDVDGETLDLREGHAAFVPAGADHRFSAYEHLTVLTILEGNDQTDQREIRRSR